MQYTITRLHIGCKRHEQYAAFFLLLHMQRPEGIEFSRFSTTAVDRLWIPLRKIENDRCKNIRDRSPIGFIFGAKQCAQFLGVFPDPIAHPPVPAPREIRIVFRAGAYPEEVPASIGSQRERNGSSNAPSPTLRATRKQARQISSDGRTRTR